MKKIFVLGVLLIPLSFNQATAEDIATVVVTTTESYQISKDGKVSDYKVQKKPIVVGYQESGLDPKQTKELSQKALNSFTPPDTAEKVTLFNIINEATDFLNASSAGLGKAAEGVTSFVGNVIKGLIP